MSSLNVIFCKLPDGSVDLKDNEVAAKTKSTRDDNYCAKKNNIVENLAQESVKNIIGDVNNHLQYSCWVSTQWSGVNLPARLFIGC